MQLTTAEAVVRCLEAEGIGHVFGISSGKMAPLMQAIARANGLRFTGVRHEAAAAHMAAACAHGTGQMAVALGELGPGGGNLLAGVASAFASNLPMLAITTANPVHLSRPSRGMMMEAPMADILRGVTKMSEVLHDGRRLPELLHRAFRIALSGRPGPVHLSIPADILAESFPYDTQAFSPPETYRPTQPLTAAPEALRRAAELLAGAKRPLLLAGGGVTRSGAAAVFTRLAERLSSPAAATQMGIGCISTAHPLFIGHGGVIGGPALRRALAEADLVLAVGCRFSSWFWDDRGPLLRGNTGLIQIDTDPEALGANVPLTLGLTTDAGTALEALESLLAASATATRSDWTAGLTAEYRAYRAALAPAQRKAEPPHPADLSEALAAVLPPEALVVYDGGHTSFWSNDILPATAPRRRFHDPGMAQLGFGTPYALALKLTAPDRLVVNVTGDGSFGFTLVELDTARREGLSIVVVIHNNAEWGIIGFGQKRAGFELGTRLDGTDYAAIARGFGCFGAKVDDPSDFAEAFRAALASGLPAVLDCRVGFVPHPGMPHFGKMALPPGKDQPLPY